MNNKTNIEEDIEILHNLIKYLQLKINEGEHKIIYNDLMFDEKTIDCVNAIENILLDRERLQEENRALREDYQTDNQYYEELIKDKIEELEKEKQEKRKILDELNIVISKQQGTETDLDSAYQYYDETFDEMLKLTYQINILQELIDTEEE